MAASKFKMKNSRVIQDHHYMNTGSTSLIDKINTTSFNEKEEQEYHLFKSPLKETPFYVYNSS